MFNSANKKKIKQPYSMESLYIFLMDSCRIPIQIFALAGPGWRIPKCLCDPTTAWQRGHQRNVYLWRISERFRTERAASTRGLHNADNANKGLASWNTNETRPMIPHLKIVSIFL